MLVAVEGDPTSSNVIATTGNGQLYLTEALQLIYTAFLNSTLVPLGYKYEYH